MPLFKVVASTRMVPALHLIVALWAVHVRWRQGGLEMYQVFNKAKKKSYSQKDIAPEPQYSGAQYPFGK